MATHTFLQECYPSESSWKKAKRIRDPAAQNTNSLDPRDLEDVVGEVIEDVVEGTVDDDAVPTEQQQREVMKIHRNLGHPEPHTLARALRNAGARRNIIRWALRDLRCAICESRERPSAKRPGALPRCLSFNKIVGVDLFEFDEFGWQQHFLNIVC